MHNATWVTKFSLKVHVVAQWESPNLSIPWAKSLVLQQSESECHLENTYFVHQRRKTMAVRPRLSLKLLFFLQEWPTAHSKSNNEAFGKALYEWSATVVGTSIKAVGACWCSGNVLISVWRSGSCHKHRLSSSWIKFGKCRLSTRAPDPNTVCGPPLSKSLEWYGGGTLLNVNTVQWETDYLSIPLETSITHMHKR